MHQQSAESRYNMNKQQANFYDSYNRSSAHYLTDVYKSMSCAKIDAFRRCELVHREECFLYGGGNVGELRIISHNSNFFSVAWTVETYDYLYLHVITPSNNYFFEVAVYA